MNRKLKLIVTTFALISTYIFMHASQSEQTNLPQTLCAVTPYFSIRSQGVDIADELVGWTQHINLFDMDQMYGSLAIKPKYTRTFNENEFCKCLFGISNCNNNSNCALTVSGSRVPNRAPTDLLADYFYLPTDFQSQLTFKPRIENALLDINCYIGFDEWVQGLFFRLHLPITHTRWNLKFCEKIIAQGTAPYDAGYFSCSPIPRNNLLNSFTEYAAGKTPTFTDPQIGVTFTGLQFAKIETCSRSKTGLAELRAILGYNIFSDEDYHLGLGLLVAVPTGNRPEGVHLFEPIVGNGKHWELGAHITGHAMLWRSEDEESSVGLFSDANITHLFESKQRRTFDIRNKPLSRYMLAEVLGTPINNGLVGSMTDGDTPPMDAVAPIAQFKNVFLPVANFTTQEVFVSAAVQADFALQLTYATGGLAWDVGYNYWARTCENIRQDCNPRCSVSSDSSCSSSIMTPFNENMFALKGDAYVYGFATNDVGAPTCVPLSATDSGADINGGDNFFNVNPTNMAAIAAARRNPKIDGAQFAYGNNAVPTSVGLTATPDGTLPDDQTHTSINPVFIKALDINNLYGNKGSSNKIYTNLSYQWLDCENWVPFIGIGGFGEFGNSGKCSNPNSDNRCCNTGCQASCMNCSLSQWGVWAKFGISFN